MTKIKRAGLGESLHTALRKCCDSEATSEAYETIDDLDDKIWNEYLDFVHSQVKDKECDDETDDDE